MSLETAAYALLSLVLVLVNAWAIRTLITLRARRKSITTPDELTKMIMDVHRFTLAEVRAKAELDAYPLEGEPLPDDACERLGLRIESCEMPQLDAQLTARAVARMSDEQRDWHADLAAQVERIAELEAESSALLGRLATGDHLLRGLCGPNCPIHQPE